MSSNNFRMCIDCVNKQYDHKLPNGMYYCPYVLGILPNGIVYYDTDAIECVRRGVFREKNNVENNAENNAENKCPT